MSVKLRTRLMDYSRLVAMLALVVVTGCAGPAMLGVDELSDAEASIQTASLIDDLLDTCKDQTCGFDVDPGAAVDTVEVDRTSSSLRVRFNDAFAQKPMRPDGLQALQQEVAQQVAPLAPGWEVDLSVLGVDPELLVPNVYRSDGGMDEKRWPEVQPATPLVSQIDRPWIAASALYGRHVAVWPSHGWYYEGRLDRWEWQRARLFQTVEDLFPMAFVVPYLAPMLERAGAYVHMPRERDVQPNEVVVDNDGHMITARPDLTPATASPSRPSDAGQGNRYLEVAELEEAWRDGEGGGFRPLDTLRMENPFLEGSHRVSRTAAMATASVSWIPDIPEDGMYAVHVSYGRTPHPTPDAQYTIHHLGGTTRVTVDQRMMPGTWVYVGTFPFAAGQRPESGRVVLSNESADPGRMVSADAVRFGGGMGSVERNGQLSGRPRFTEGARYYMQYAGLPDTLVYNVTETANDYVDDYRSRAEWVNYLRGAPLGPNKDREAQGLGVPVDVSLAFHTDAGVTKSDATIGTLMIYSSTGMEGERDFPSGFSRFANRDLGDAMQTQIVDDVRALYDSTWTRRAIWDRDYSEAVRPNVPGVLLELLSHQNFADMRFGLDPRFRFDVARSIYKSTVRFLADQYGFDPIIQPLPPDHVQARWVDGAIRVSWEGVKDPLEPTAVPDAYVVYTRTMDGGFDNGRLVRGSAFDFTGARTGVVYGFRVAAVSAGGESAPSETVAAAMAPERDGMARKALIVSAFDRVSAPGTVEAGSFRGFASWVDEGVPDAYDLSYVGDQYDFDVDSPWLDDDSPGHGASWSTWETRALKGNTKDYSLIHARALLSAGMSSETVSDEVFDSFGGVDGASVPTDVALLAMQFGEEKTTEGPGVRVDFTVLTEATRSALAAFMASDIPILMSGAHIATDAAGPDADKSSVAFMKAQFGVVWRTDRAVQNGQVNVLPADSPRDFGADASGFDQITFNTDPHGPVYRVEHPDALDPDGDAETLMRYGDNNMSAAVGRPGHSLVLGFPFETILSAGERAALMRAIVRYLE